MSKSSIEWTEATWNPITGCSKISAGCTHCYAETMSKRLQAMGVGKYQEGFSVVKFHPETLLIPFGWKKPRTIFVNSMSDLFHKEVLTKDIQSIFSVMNECSLHNFQILTKRSDRLAAIAKDLNWSKNIWVGVSIENEANLGRIEHLKKVPAAVRFLSIEPLLGPLPEIDLTGINWVIVGGESGPKARPIKEEWVLGIRDNCLKAGVPFFFKQWGGKNKKKAGKLLQGETWMQLPAITAS